MSACCGLWIHVTRHVSFIICGELFISARRLNRIKLSILVKVNFCEEDGSLGVEGVGSRWQS